jgi:acetyl esterase/lipase
MRFIASVLAIFIFCSRPACAAGAAVPRVERGVVYSTVQGEPLKLDVYELQQAGAKPMPLVLCVHGGGWSSGDRSQMVQMAIGLAGHGYCAASIDYRLSQQAKWPAQLTDVKNAIKYMVAHAKEYNIDPRRIGIIGGSAGGQLALMVGVTDSQASKIQTASAKAPPMVRAVISMAGPTDLTRPFPAFALNVVQGLLGRTRTAAAMPLFRAASPVAYVNKSAAPMLMVHGDKDEIVPYDQAQEMLAQSKKVGAQAQLFTIHGGAHGGGGNEKERQASVRAMLDFLAKKLQP